MVIAQKKILGKYENGAHSACASQDNGTVLRHGGQDSRDKKRPSASRGAAELTPSVLLGVRGRSEINRLEDGRTRVISKSPINRAHESNRLYPARRCIDTRTVNACETSPSS